MNNIIKGMEDLFTDLNEIDLKLSNILQELENELLNSYNFTTFLSYIEKNYMYLDDMIDFFASIQNNFNSNDFEHFLIRFHRKFLVILPNQTSVKIREIKSNWSFNNVNFQNKENDDLRNFESLSSEKKIFLMYRIKTYVYFFIKIKFFDLYVNYNTIKYWSTLNKLIYASNIISNCFYKPELLHLLDEIGIKNIKKICSEWESTLENFDDENLISIRGTLAHNSVLAFYFFYKAFRGENDNLNTVIEYITADLNFFNAYSKSKIKKLNSFTELGKYSYIDIMRYFENLPYDRINNTGFYIFNETKGIIFKRNVKYVVDFGQNSNKLMTSTYETISLCEKNNFKWHMDFFKQFDNSDEFLKKINKNSSHIKFEKKFIKRINYIKKHGFPQSPIEKLHSNSRKEIVDEINKILFKELKFSTNLAKQIVISLLIAELLNDSNITDATVIFFLYRVVKIFDKKQYHINLICYIIFDTRLSKKPCFSIFQLYGLNSTWRSVMI